MESIVNDFIRILLDIVAPLGISEVTFQFMLVAAVLGVSIYLTLHTGMFSLANVGFMAIGAYVAALLTRNYDASLLTAIIIGSVTAGVIAIPIGLPVLRLRDIYLAIATIGFNEVVRIFFLNYDSFIETYILGLTSPRERREFEVFGGSVGIRDIPTIAETWMLIFFLLVLVFFMIRLHRSRFGRAMAAIRQDEHAASNMGINVVFVKNAVFIMSAMIAAAAGAFNVHLIRTITPSQFDFALTVDILAYAVLGGTQTWLGPIIGGMTLRALPETLRFVQEYRGLVTGLILLGVIVYFPGGLVNITAMKKWFGGLFQQRVEEHV